MKKVLFGVSLLGLGFAGYRYGLPLLKEILSSSKEIAVAAAETVAEELAN